MAAVLTNLQELSLDNNGIETLPEEIHLLSSLATLKLSGNRLESLPSSMCTLSL